MNTLQHLRTNRQNLQTTHTHYSWVASRVAFFVLLVALLSAHVVTFAKTVTLSDEISHIETTTQELQKENTQLEQKLYAQNSISNLQELAAQLGFTKESEPIFLDSSQVALVP